jgi:hypothetical protein
VAAGTGIEANRNKKKKPENGTVQPMFIVLVLG